MSNTKKKWKLGKVAREFNVSLDRVIEVLKKEGFKGYKGNPNEKIDEDIVRKLARHFGMDKKFKSLLEEKKHTEEEKQKETLSLSDIKKEAQEEEEGVDVGTIYIKDSTTGAEIPVDKDSIELEKEKKTPQPEPQPAEQTTETLTSTPIGPKILGEIDLDKLEQTTRPKKKKDKRPKDKTTEKQPDKTPQKPETQTETKPKQQETSEEFDVYKRIEEITKPFEIQQKHQEQVKEQAPKAEQEQPKPEPEAAQTEQQPQQPSDTQPETQTTEAAEQLTQEPKISVKVVGQIDLDKIERKEKPSRKERKEREKTKERERRRRDRERGRRSRKESARRVERVDIEQEAKRIRTRQTKRKTQREVVIDQKEVEKSYKETIFQATAKIGKSIQKKRHEKKKLKEKKKLEAEQQESKRLTITEFLTVGQLATLMGVDPVELLQKTLSLGIRATVNYPLEADDIELLASEYGYEVEFVDVTTMEELEAQYEDKEEDLVPRPPIVTVMGHVDHGKTTLLDYIRKTNVVAGEAGGITQHIGAYHITLDDGREITFIDTPGHEAFTAMRARGAKVTDIAVIVIAADDGVRPQTEEALDHAKAAGVPIIFAINKVDKDTADPEKIRNQLAQRGYLVSSWGGDYFDVEISAKTGYNIDELLETILLVAEDLDLKANPNRPAIGTVLEASVEKGRGPVANILVRTGTLRVGDVILAGSHYGKVRAMFNERMQRIKEAGPSIPAQILGLDGVPEPGEPFMVMENEKLAKQKANQRAQIKRVIQRRARKALTLEEISRRLQLGEFNEINIIIRADVQGTADALADQLEKLSTDEVQVNVIRKATGQISESDVMLAHVSKAIIIGFNVRPTAQVRKLAEQKEVEIRTYSVIYHAIEDIKDAIRGMLKPIQKEEHLGTAKVLKTFKIKGVGTVAGCQVEEGKITRDARVRVIRNGVVVYEGEIASLKHYQEDVQEIRAPQECGLAIKNFNDIKKDDQIEAFKLIEIEREI